MRAHACIHEHYSSSAHSWTDIQAHTQVHLRACHLHHRCFWLLAFCTRFFFCTCVYICIHSYMYIYIYIFTDTYTLESDPCHFAHMYMLRLGQGSSSQCYKNLSASVHDHKLNHFPSMFTAEIANAPVNFEASDADWLDDMMDEINTNTPGQWPSMSPRLWQQC